MDPTQPVATQTQNTREDLAVLYALEQAGTLLAIAERVAKTGVDLTPERLQVLLDEHVAEYRVLCGAGGVYVRLPAGARAVANAGLVQGGRA